MPRAQRRTWIKLYCYGRLHGSVTYQLTEAEQSIWDKLLCLAGLCGLDGLIADNDRHPFPHAHIAHELHTSEELLESTLTKCKDEGRISENTDGISITNWKAYQSEYERQKPYRQAAAAAKLTPSGNSIICPYCHKTTPKNRLAPGNPVCQYCQKSLELPHP